MFTPLQLELNEDATENYVVIELNWHRPIENNISNKKLNSDI